MTEENKKNKSGAGKFFLGALLGIAAGVTAKHLAKKKKNCNCCNEDCDCAKDGSAVADLETKAEEIKKDDKKTTDKKD